MRLASTPGLESAACVTDAATFARPPTAWSREARWKIVITGFSPTLTAGGRGVPAIVLQGDARHLPLPDGCVDLIVTSPPYWSLRDYRDNDASLAGQLGSEATPAEYIANLLDCTREWIRVLKPRGNLFVNIGDAYSAYNNNRGPSRSLSAPADPGRGHIVKPGLPDHVRAKSLYGLPWRYALGCIDELSLILRAEIVWHKTSGMPESVKDRVRRSHEQVFHFTRQSRYDASVDEIREGHAPQSIARTHRRYDAGDSFSVGTPNTLDPAQFCNPLGKLPGSVWDIPSAPLVVPDRIAHARCCGGRKREGCEDGLAHYAAYPPALVRPIILGWSPGGGLVVDPLGGTGTSALVADVFGRTGLTFDLSGDYCRLARWRTTDPGERARAMQVPKPPPVIDGQLDMFAGTP